MPRAKKTRKRSQSATEVGRQVTLGGAYDGLRGVVIEDRGKIGPDGQRVYRVSVATTSTAPVIFEAPASLVHVIEATSVNVPAKKAAAISSRRKPASKSRGRKGRRAAVR